ncbi:hypothetical protein ACUH78_05525 [Thauera sp. ZXT1-4]|uniref:hypothetical protein n=1 Tax=Thauera sp. ZXT1-4 TaxID=3460294 RepID=UPI00404097CB
MNAPAILYRHCEGRGTIVADPANLRLIVSDAEQERPVFVTIGPRGMRSLAAELLKVAESIEGGAK